MPGVARGLYLDLSQCFVKCFVLACIFRFKGKQLVTKHGVGVGSRLKKPIAPASSSSPSLEAKMRN